jgi:hypothetical protein
VKARIPTAAISRTLQAVATLGVVTPHAVSETTKPSVISDPLRGAEDTQAFSVILSELSEQQEVSSAVKFPHVAEWDHASDKRFVELVEREATGAATKKEMKELERLTGLRRQAEAPRTGEEVVREYEQHQLISNLLQSLTRYVEFIGGAATEPSSSRSRTKAKA